MRVPRAPLSPPDDPPKLDSAVRQIASHPNVMVLDERPVQSSSNIPTCFGMDGI